MDNIKYEPEETFCQALFLLFLHKVYMASVVILHFLRLVGNESLSNVEARQKEVKLAGIAIKEAKKSLAEHISSILYTNPHFHFEYHKKIVGLQVLHTKIDLS